MSGAEFGEGRPKVFEERLGRYSDFVDRHKDKEGGYDWELGLAGLLSTLTPDAKAITLYAMPSETPFFNGSQLYGNVLHFLEELGLQRRFPLVQNALWAYCYTPSQKDGEGSLVSIGAVVREMQYQTSEGPKTAYLISSSGNDLAKPLVVAAFEWIDFAQKSNIPHKFDSMWRVFGSVASKYENRRPLSLYRVVEYLVQNPGYQRCQDVQEVLKLKGKINDMVVSTILNSLGQAGVIDYDSPHRDREGKTQRGWVTYSLQQETSYQEAISKIKAIRSGFHSPGYLKQVLDFIEDNPYQTYETNSLSQNLGIRSRDISNILSPLQQIGMLKRESGFQVGKVLSRARANELTKALYNMVLLPAKETAQTLKPSHNRPLTSHLARVVLQNFQEERTNIGPQGGEEVRDTILQLLDQYGAMKTSHIGEEGNKRLDRELGSGAWPAQLKNLIKTGKIEKAAGKSVYRLAKNQSA